MESSATVKKLAEEFQKLPGIGRKTAERLVFALLKSKSGMAASLSKALSDLSEKVKLCGVCGGITETEPCSICASPKRDKSLVCVVEQPLDIAVLERTGSFNGTYHVLGGTLSPLDGVGPEMLRIEQLIKRIKEGTVTEVIVATNPTMDGEATALYLAKMLRPYGSKISRIARGVPVGSDLEYVDEITLIKSLEGRREM